MFGQGIGCHQGSGAVIAAFRDLLKPALGFLNQRQRLSGGTAFFQNASEKKAHYRDVVIGLGVGGFAFGKGAIVKLACAGVGGGELAGGELLFDLGAPGLETSMAPALGIERPGGGVPRGTDLGQHARPTEILHEPEETGRQADGGFGIAVGLDSIEQGHGVGQFQPGQRGSELGVPGVLLHQKSDEATHRLGPAGFEFGELVGIESGVQIGAKRRMQTQMIVGRGCRKAAFDQFAGQAGDVVLLPLHHQM